MVALPGVYNPEAPENNVSTSNVVPAGFYTLYVADAEIRDTKDMTGKMLKLDLQIVGGEFQNRHVFANVNAWLDPSKATALNIGRRQLSDLCRACKIAALEDTDQLLGKVVVAKVKVSPPRDGYDASNDIAAFFASDDPKAVAGLAAAVTHAGPPTAAPGNRMTPPPAAPTAPAAPPAGQAAPPAALGNHAATHAAAIREPGQDDDETAPWN